MARTATECVAEVVQVDPGDASRRAGDALGRWAFPAAAAVILALGAWHYRWMSDDAFITLRVVKQIVEGHGPVFNVGERVEASTSPLWTFLLAAADVLSPVRLEWIAVLGGIALTIAGFVCIMAGSSCLYGERSRADVLVPAGGLVLAAYAPMWKFASSGLETGLSFLWLGVCLVVLARGATNGKPVPLWGLVVLGLGPLVRPDFVLYSVAFVALALVFESTNGRRVRAVAVAFALPVAYQLFRMGYYGSLVPNAALAKEASRPYWSRGWQYLGSATYPYKLWFPMAVLAIGAYGALVRGAVRDSRTRVTAVAVVFAGAALVHALYVVRVGGDLMHVRLLMPAFFAFAAPVAVVPLRKNAVVAALIAVWGAVALVGLRTTADAPQAFGPSSRNAVTTNDFGFNPGGPSLRWYKGPGVYFTTQLLPATSLAGAPDPAVTGYGIGVTSYALRNVYVLDLLGLADGFTAHLKIEHRGTVAHEKPLPFPWIAARLTSPDTHLKVSDFREPQFFLAAPIDDPGGEPFDARVAQARQALDCGPIRDLLASEQAKLTPLRFLHNIVDSFGETRLRIPPEPRDALHELCAKR